MSSESRSGGGLIPRKTSVLDQLDRRTRHFNAVREITEALASALELEATLDTITRITSGVMGVASCSIYLQQKGSTRLVLKATTGLARSSVGTSFLELGEGLTGWTVAHAQPVAAREARVDPRFKLLPETDEEELQSLLAMPLTVQGRTIGAINVQTREVHDFREEEIELLSLIANLAAGALEKAALYDSMRQQIRELEGLVQISRTVISPLYLDEMLGVVAEMAARVMGARAVMLHLLDEASGRLELRATHNTSPERRAHRSLAVGESIVGEAARAGKPVSVLDVLADPRYLNPELARAEGLVSLLSVPLMVRERTVGVLSCYTDSPHAFTEMEIGLFSALGNQTALAIENSRLVISTAVVREMHHRVKNNLQTVAMLLRLQMGAAGDEKTRSILGDAMTRILSIAAVHETLSEQGLRLVDVKKVLERISHNVAELVPGKQIAIAVEGDSLTLPSKPATSLALVVSELVQNALKHAFRDREQGRVLIALRAEGGDLLVQVTDDGVGSTAPAPAGKPARKGLGLDIIKTLVHDLKGHFEVRFTDRGSQALVRFPAPPADGASL
jgi:two-component system, sensor histidine kinase PdtaS